MNMKNSAKLLVAFLLVSLVGISPTQAATVRPIIFPVIGSVSYYDDFGAPRVGHTHQGNDLMGHKLMPLVAAVDGTVSWVQYPEPSWGYAIAIRDSEGYEYWYLHVNNDNPGTDDGLGGGIHAYAPDIINGATVVKGQFIGWMGDSGDAESTTPHLHFEIHDPSGTAFSPFASLQAATKITTPVPEPRQPNEILPFANFKGGASVAVGNFGGDARLVAGAGPGGGPDVKVLASDGTVISDFFPYPKTFKGGVDVAAGDINGDGVDEIVTGAGPGGGPQVRILTSTGIPIKSFMAYPLAFKGGVRVAVADVDNDGKAEIITGAGPGGGPQVRIFKADGTPISSFMAYAPTFRGGVDVAVKASSGSTPARIVTSALSAGGPHVRTFDTLGNPDVSFMAYAPEFRGGVKVAVTNVDQTSGTFSIVTVPASKGGPDIRIFSSLGLLTNSLKVFEPWWRGGYEVGTTATGTVYITADGRRASIRTLSTQVYNNTNNNNYNGNNNVFGSHFHGFWMN